MVNIVYFSMPEWNMVLKQFYYIVYSKALSILHLTFFKLYLVSIRNLLKVNISTNRILINPTPHPGGFGGEPRLYRTDSPLVATKSRPLPMSDKIICLTIIFVVWYLQFLFVWLNCFCPNNHILICLIDNIIRLFENIIHLFDQIIFCWSVFSLFHRFLFLLSFYIFVWSMFDEVRYFWN